MKEKKEKKILTHERLIFALDLPDFEKAKDCINRLSDAVHFYKIGLELILSQDLYKVLDLLKKLGHKIFLDCKLFDIPETVQRAIKNLKLNKVECQFITVHGNDEILKAAVNLFDENNPILSVLHLTSLGKEALNDLRFHGNKIEDLIQTRAKMTYEIGCIGAVCAPNDLLYLDKKLKENLIFVTPGIRNTNVMQDDHKRTMNIEEAFDSGSDYLVIGRPIREAKDPYEAAWKFQEQIQKYFNKKI